MSFLPESELLQSQSTWKRSQIRLPPTLSEAITQYERASNLASFNTALLMLLNDGLKQNKAGIVASRKIIFTDWHPTQISQDHSPEQNEAVRMACAKYMSDFFQNYPSHELVKFEFKKDTYISDKKVREVLFGIRIWYSYPTNEQ